MSRFSVSFALVAVAVLGVGSAAAQSVLSLEATSPLGLGLGAPQAPTGIPLGATELATPGLSPMPMDPATLASVGVIPPCASADSTGTGMTAATIFDGGGTTPTTVVTCPGTAAGLAANPATSASSPSGMGATAVPRAGIPFGSVELGGGGLSPLPGPTSMVLPPVTPAAAMAVFVPAPVAAVPSAASPAIDCPSGPVLPGRPASAPVGC